MKPVPDSRQGKLFIDVVMLSTLPSIPKNIMLTEKFEEKYEYTNSTAELRVTCITNSNEDIISVAKCKRQKCKK